MVFNKYFFITLILLFGTISCKKEQNPVPVTSVNILIFNIDTDSRYTSLRVPLHSAYVQKTSDCLGYDCNGVVIFRKKLDYAYDDYRAFDRTCTYEAHDCAMEIDPAFPDLLICPCCGSIFSMDGGYMVQGPAKFPLREFQCEYYDGDLRIY